MSAVLEKKVEALEQELAALQKWSGVRRGIRKRSEIYLLEMPLWEIALGPDPENQEVRGHAQGWIAIGDMATGAIAVGGFARGLVALGGVAIGGVCFGGCALGLVAGFGGLATGGLAMGGLAVGLVAIGGGAIGAVAIGGGGLGYYALGGGALGKHTFSAMQQDPEAIRFFSQFISWIH